jgi:L-cystine uptake protein TcyP (sodium:dicarboxylate symporter family)
MIISSISAVLTLILSFHLLYAAKHRQFQLGTRILFGMLFGIIYGLTIKFLTADPWLPIIRNSLYLVGEGYLALLKMLVIPLILTSIIHAILNLGTGSSIKKLSLTACGMLLGMTAIASLIGMVVGEYFAVGQGMNLPTFAETPKHIYTGMTETLLGMLPTNPVAAMTESNTIAIVLFAVLLGIAARMLDVSEHEKMETFRKWIASLFAIIKKLAGLIIGLTPYGVFALISLLLLDQGITLLLAMLNFIVAMYAAMLIVILMHCGILASVGYSPWKYFKKAYMPLFVAFTTRSSFGTLPVTEETLHNQFKISQVTSTFVPSLGATMGMNACAGIFPAMLVVMTLTILHQPLTLHLIVMVMMINTIASLGISGIPGTAYIAATVTLSSLNLPYAIVGLVQGIDPIIDMGRTATNVNGVMTAALVTEKVLESSSYSTQQACPHKR